MLLILLLPPIVELGFKGSHAQGVQAMGWFIIALLPPTIALAIWRVGEPAPAEKASIRLADYLELFRNPSVVRLVVTDLLMGWAPAITATLFLFYFDQIKGVPEGRANLLLLTYFVAAMAGAPLWSWLATLIGKHLALAGNALTILASLVLVMAAPMKGAALPFAVMALAGLPYAGAGLLVRAMLADAGDELRLQTGADRTGLLYALLTGTNKIGSALALTTFVILDAVGFDARAAHNAPRALMGLQVMFVALPGALSLLSAIVILGYRLDSRRHADIRTALAHAEGHPSP